MFKYNCKYTDLNGVEREEDYYFNLTKAEIMEMQFESEGGLDKKIEKIVKSKNEKQVFSIFKEIVLKAYGIKSEDGKRFIKNQAVREEFEQSVAYSELIMELLSDENKATNFMTQIIPKVDQVKEIPATTK